MSYDDGNISNKVAVICVFLQLFIKEYCLCAPAKLKLISDNPKNIYELDSRSCKAGFYVAEPKVYSCACVTGVWGFYSSFCSKPVLFVGGDNYCFPLNGLAVTEGIFFGVSKYPFEPTIVHFRDDFSVMTKAFLMDENLLELDPMSSFITITNHPWTLSGDTGSTLCLNATMEKTKVYCLFKVSSGSLVVSTWETIKSVRRGCFSDNVVQPDTCFDIHPPNDITSCMKRGSSLMKPPVDNTAISVITPVDPLASQSNAEDNNLTSVLPTPPPWKEDCSHGFSEGNLEKYWAGHGSQPCPSSMTEFVFRDQLKRFAVAQLNQKLQTRQTSLMQTEELLLLQADLIKSMCPADAVSHEFIDVVTEAFNMFLKDDFFYSVVETESAIFERIAFGLKTCVQKAQPFEFHGPVDKCAGTRVIQTVVVNGKESLIVVSEKSTWRNFEPIIEANWKVFLHAHSYCVDNFLQQNDHHIYALRMMKLFSNSIYEKWMLPLMDLKIYEFILPNADHLELTLDNLDRCVGALNFNTRCSAWLDRRVPRDVDLKPGNKPDITVDAQPMNHHQHHVGNDNLAQEVRQKRSSENWEVQLKRNRASSQIWNGLAHCLQTPQDPSFYLGYEVCDA